MHLGSVRACMHTWVVWVSEWVWVCAGICGCGPVRGWGWVCRQVLVYEWWWAGVGVWVGVGV